MFSQTFPKNFKHYFRSASEKTVIQSKERLELPTDTSWPGIGFGIAGEVLLEIVTLIESVA